MSRQHSCHKADRSTMTTRIIVQDGWVEHTINGQRLRVPNFRPHVTHWLPHVKCGYLHRQTDEDCGTCQWRQHP